MDPCHESFTFILRIWCEPREIDRAPALWRGVIETVPDGERQYVRTLEEIDHYLIPYLEQFGARISLRWRARRWLSERLRRPTVNEPEPE
jgi:hypothetical protein